MRSFERVTGDKTDEWLVKTVGGLLTAVGIVLARAAATDTVDEELRTLAIETAVVLTTVDVVYVAQRRIPKVYLLDAIVHAGLVGMWFAARLRPRQVRVNR